MYRPVIGVAVWKRQLPTALGERETLHALADPYVQSITRAKGIPVLLPSLTDEEVPALLDLIDGLVLSGGGDVAPSTYGAPDDGVSTAVDEDADSFETALVRHAEARDLPVLGICRGCQILNVAFGGTLHQDITEEGSAHGGLAGQTPDELLSARHEVAMVEGSTLAGVYGVERRMVNSIHHQAIDEVADGFSVAAVAPDGTVEAIEATGSWTALGVQWHPERMTAHEEAPLFRSFVDAVRSRIVEPGGVRFA